MNPKYPKIDRSDFKPNFVKKDLDDDLDIAWGEGVFSGGRPYRVEFWAANQVSYLTYFFSTIDIENLTPADLKEYLKSERVIEFNEEKYLDSGLTGINASAGKMMDSSGNEMWSVTVIVGDEDGTYIKGYTKLQKYENSIEVPKSKELDSWEWNNMGVFFKDAGNYELSIEWFDKAIEIDPENSGAWSNKGNTFQCMGRDAEARHSYEQAIRINPSNVQAWINKGSLLASTGETGESLRCLNRALDIKSQMTLHIASFIMNIVGHGGFNPSDMGDICRKITRLDIMPNDVDGFINLGLCHLQIDEVDEALDLFLKAERLDNQDSGIWSELMEVYFKKHNPEMTMKYCDKLIAVNYNIEEAINKKSRVLSYIGRANEAILLLQDFLKNNPNMEFLWSTLSEIHEQNKNYISASQAAEKCLHLVMKNEKENIIRIKNLKRRVDLLRRREP